MSQMPHCDPAFMEAISKNMRVPQRLSVSPWQQWQEEQEEESTRRPEDPQSTYTMQVPDRLTYTEAPDMSPRPLFTPSRPTLCGPIGLELCWESPSGEVSYREAPQSPIRRSFSDQGFGRTPPVTPTRLKHPPVLHRHTSSPRHHQSSTFSPQVQAQPPPSTLHSLMSPQSVLQVAKQLGMQASQRFLQAVSQKYRGLSNQEKLPPARVMTRVPTAAHEEHSKTSVRTIENWSPEDEEGAAVEFIILRRQVMKMSRRLAALERRNADQRNTEVVLFSLLFSACLLNIWLWIRR